MRAALGVGAQLRAALDDAIIGQEDAKEAVVLALLAKEHAYIEGPPGVAKTLIAEIVSREAGLMTFTHQMSRLLLIEQMYRATEIRKGSGYHKD